MMGSCRCPAVALVAGCSNKSSGSASESAGGGKKLAIFATTGYLADAAKVLDPDAEITTMVKPGGDPHTYEPTTQDIEKMQSADAVFSSGVHLEAKMLTQLESLGSKHIAVGNKIDQSELLPWPEKDEQGNELHDPHIWNAPATARQMAENTLRAFCLLDTAHTAVYRAAHASLVAEIDSTDAAPPSRRPPGRGGTTRSTGGRWCRPIGSPCGTRSPRSSQCISST